MDSAGTSVHNSTGVLAGGWFLAELASTCPAHPAGTSIQLCIGVLAGGWFLAELASTCTVHSAGTSVHYHIAGPVPALCGRLILLYSHV
jgi:energy-converting hydrogenase Eha subunit B